MSGDKQELHGHYEMRIGKHWQPVTVDALKDIIASDLLWPKYYTTQQNVASWVRNHSKDYRYAED